MKPDGDGEDGDCFEEDVGELPGDPGFADGPLTEAQCKALLGEGVWTSSWSCISDSIVADPDQPSIKQISSRNCEPVGELVASLGCNGGSTNSACSYSFGCRWYSKTIP